MRNIHASGVYFLWDEDELVYIGESENIYLRIGQHIKDGRKRFDDFTIYITEDRKLLEAYLINVLKPKYNKAHNQRPGYRPSNTAFVEGTMNHFNNPELALAIRAFESYKREAEEQQ
jgi:excinuclease UvrABC nuclease subunit